MPQDKPKESYLESKVNEILRPAYLEAIGKLQSEDREAVVLYVNALLEMRHLDKQMANDEAAHREDSAKQRMLYPSRVKSCVDKILMIMCFKVLYVKQHSYFRGTSQVITAAQE